MTFSTRQHIAYMLSVLYAIAGLSVCLSVTWPLLTVHVDRLSTHCRRTLC